MKLSKLKLRKIIEAALLNEGRMSRSERELIRLQVEIELGEEFELLAAQAKDLEDYNRIDAIFQQQVREETQKRVAARETGMADPPIQSLKVKINSLKNKSRYADPDDKKSFEDQFQQTTNQEIVPVSPRPTNRPSVEMTPEEAEQARARTYFGEQDYYGIGELDLDVYSEATSQGTMPLYQSGLATSLFANA